MAFLNARGGVLPDMPSSVSVPQYPTAPSFNPVSRNINLGPLGSTPFYTNDTGQGIYEHNPHQKTTRTTLALKRQPDGNPIEENDLLMVHVDRFHTDHSVTIFNIQKLNYVMEKAEIAYIEQQLNFIFNPDYAGVNRDTTTPHEMESIKQYIPTPSYTGQSMAIRAANLWNYIGMAGRKNADFRRNPHLTVALGPNVRTRAIGSASNNVGDNYFVVIKQVSLQEPHTLDPMGNRIQTSSVFVERAPIQFIVFATASPVPLPLSRYPWPANDDLAYLEYNVPIKPKIKKWVKDERGRLFLKTVSSSNNPSDNGIFYFQSLLQEGVAIPVGQIWENNQKSTNSEAIKEAQRNASVAASIGHVRLTTR